MGDETEPKKKKVLEYEDVMQDFKRAFFGKKKWMLQAERDFNYTLGKQWSDEDIETLRVRKVKCVTLNKIRPAINLLVGIESQNRTDFLAYPEGEEDSVKAEIATKLLKHVMKMSDGDYKTSESFEDGCTCGEGTLEPWIDYTYDFLYGRLQWKKGDYNQWFFAPGFKEYDLSDCKYACKLTRSLTKDDLEQLFPDINLKLETIGKEQGIFDLESWSVDSADTGAHRQKQGYSTGEEQSNMPPFDRKEPVYDLLEYYYKHYVIKFYVVDSKIGSVKSVPTKEEGVKFVEMAKMLADKQQQPMMTKVIERKVPEIWVASVIGNRLIDDTQAWTYPRWRHFPVIPYWAYRSTAPIERRELLVQGVATGMISQQEEYNKRRSQELHILNTSANSGWLVEHNAFIDKDKVENFGSSAGVLLEFKAAIKWKPEKIRPTELSQGHAQLAQEMSQDMKECSGINADLLSMTQNKVESGRAIGLRLQQGRVMVQRLYDNLSRTKRIQGRFVLSQLSELFSVATAVKVMGDAYIKENFSRPVMQEKKNEMTGEMEEVPVMISKDEMEMKLDEELVASVFNTVLSDTELGTYDVSIGEGASSETVRYANYLTLKELAESGVQIPAEIIIDESLLTVASKEKIKKAIARAQAAAAEAQTTPTK